MIILQFFQDAIIEADRIMDSATDYDDTKQFKSDAQYIQLAKEFKKRGSDIESSYKWSDLDNRQWDELYYGTNDNDGLCTKYRYVRADYKRFWWVKK